MGNRARRYLAGQRRRILPVTFAPPRRPLVCHVTLCMSKNPLPHARCRVARRHPSRADRSSLPKRSGSARMSISRILPPDTVKPMTEKGLPSGSRETTPAAPFTSAGWETRPGSSRLAKVSAWLATARAPRTSLGASPVSARDSSCSRRGCWPPEGSPKRGSGEEEPLHHESDRAAGRG